MTYYKINVKHKYLSPRNNKTKPRIQIHPLTVQHSKGQDRTAQDETGLVLYFSSHATFYFFSTAFQREMLHFLLHRIY